jgi:hypothetical protein
VEALDNLDLTEDLERKATLSFAAFHSEASRLLRNWVWNQCFKKS